MGGDTLMRLRWLVNNPDSNTYRSETLEYWDEEGEYWRELDEVTCTDATYKKAHSEKEWQL